MNYSWWDQLTGEKNGKSKYPPMIISFHTPFPIFFFFFFLIYTPPSPSILNQCYPWHLFRSSGSQHSYCLSSSVPLICNDIKLPYLSGFPMETGGSWIVCSRVLPFLLFNSGASPIHAIHWRRFIPSYDIAQLPIMSFFSKRNLAFKNRAWFGITSLLT